MHLLRIDASIQGDHSASSALADLVHDRVTAAHPEATVVRRHVGRDALPSDAWGEALSGSAIPEQDRSESQRRALALAERLATELQQATTAILAFPLYNYGISQHAKAWIDLAVVGAPHGARLLDGTPTVLVVTRGGSYGPGTPRDGWDHSTDYARRILVDVWGADLTIVERDFTLVGVNPALDEFTETAAMMRKTAEEKAVSAGELLAAGYAA